MSPEAIVAQLRKFGLRLDLQAADLIEQVRSDNAIMRRALESIAANGCCDRCQEAALVARSALSRPHRETP